MSWSLKLVPSVSVDLKSKGALLTALRAYNDGLYVTSENFAHRSILDKSINKDYLKLHQC